MSRKEILKNEKYSGTFVNFSEVSLLFARRASDSFDLGACGTWNHFRITGTNEVSGTSECLPLEPPVPDTGAGKSSLRGNRKKLSRLHIFKGRVLIDGLK